MNKKVKKARTSDRNRQNNVATEAMVELHMGLYGRKSSPQTKTYLQYRKEHIGELRALKVEAEAEAEAELLIDAAAAADNTEELKEDDEDGDDNAIALEIAGEIAQEETTKRTKRTRGTWCWVETRGTGPRKGKNTTHATHNFICVA
jgi:hypothetical protein